VRPAAAPQTVEVVRATTIRKHRIGFFYWVREGCSSAELPAVQVIGQPRNGKISVERGTGFPSFPKSNPHYACNDRQSNGVVVSYEPDARFVGFEEITVKVTFPSGSSFMRHYRIEVTAGGTVSSLPAHPVN